MSNLPLYDTLMNSTKNKDLTAAQKVSLVNKIEGMDHNGHEIVYVLIKTYYINTENKTPYSIPYIGEVNDDTVTFDMNNFPPKLKQILNEFAKMHYKRMKEEEAIKDICV